MNQAALSLSMLLCLLLSSPLSSQTSFPKWGLSALAEAGREPDPPGADAWVLLDRTEFTFTASGEMKIHRYRLVKILTESGAWEYAVFSLRGPGGKASKVKSLVGWNFRPGGDPIQVKRDQAVVLDPDAGDAISADNLTAVALPGVVPGSLVAFESQEVLTSSMGPMAVAPLVESCPVLRWELEADKSWWAPGHVKLELIPIHISEWSTEIESEPGRSLKVRHIPAVPQDERFAPGPFRSHPLVFLKYSAREFPATSATTWAGFGKWYFELFNRAPGSIPDQGLRRSTQRDSIEALWNWMMQTFIYKQIYLSEQRGWAPAPVDQTLRRRSGDCKDLVAMACNAAKSAGLEGLPVLTRIQDGPLSGGEPIHPGIFNHVIVAFPLKEPLGLPSEVSSGGRSFLLLDPTDKVTPFGFLGPQHANAKVLLCSPEGGVWLEVPINALTKPTIQAHFDGEVEVDGQLRAVLHLEEQGHALGLAQAWLNGGNMAVERALTPHLSLLPGIRARVTDTKTLDDGQKRFQVTLEIQSQGILSNGDLSVMLPLIGAPRPPKPVSRPGSKRILPVQIPSPLVWTWDARVRTPGNWLPREAASHLSTPIRDVSWVAQAVAGELRLRLAEQVTPKEWSWESRPDGVNALDEDRLSFNAFLSICSEFLVPPTTQKAH